MPVGILAYGSIVTDAGTEILPLIVRRHSVVTPFPIEFVRLSRTRGGAPTVAPHHAGVGVRAQLLELVPAVSEAAAADLLWRRETSNVGSRREYRESTSANAVLVRRIESFHDIDCVVYTDFNQSGKVAFPNAEQLAHAGIESVRHAAKGRDGISYLMDLIDLGIRTSLTEGYKNAILALTAAPDLNTAREKVLLDFGLSP